MKTARECLPCFVSQVERTLRHAGVNGDRGMRLLEQARGVIAQAFHDRAPARIATDLHRLLRADVGADPYRSVKQQSTAAALALLPALRRRVVSAPDPFEACVRAAIAGNVIDFGIYDSFDLNRSVSDAFRLPLPADTLHAFSRAAGGAKRVLYLCDNAGEIVFDRLLIDLLRRSGVEVTAAVKGAAVINDATRDDAAQAGLFESATVIDNGNDGIGTLLELCSREFLEAWQCADVIISKGQANFETLQPEADDRLFFLFKAKCSVVAKALGRQKGDSVLLRAGRGTGREGE